MNYQTLLDRAWSLVDTVRPPGADLSVKDIGDIESGAIAGIDAAGRRHLLIAVSPGTRITPDLRSSGVHVVRRELLDGGLMKPFLDVVCLKPYLHELFAVIASEILDLLPEHRDHPDAAAHQVLSRWRELIEREFRTGGPAIEKVEGIFGELWYLRNVIRYNSEALGIWVGPLGALHDLTGDKSALEVKTTRSRKGRQFEINGERQLEAEIHTTLYLGCLKLEITGEESMTVSELIEEIVGLGADRDALLSTLARTGVTLGDLAISPVAFRVLESRVYEVDADFPRITPQSFVSGALPSGVTELSYDIDLSQEPPTPLTADRLETLYRGLAGMQ